VPIWVFFRKEPRHLGPILAQKSTKEEGEKMSLSEEARELLKAYIIATVQGVPTEGKEFDELVNDIHQYAIEFAIEIAPKAFELYLKEKW